MDDFVYRNGQLFCEQISLDELAQKVGTPAYIYSRHTFEAHYDRIARAFAALEPTICYSIKSCGNIHLCKLLAARGAGMDVVSGGELHRARLAGVPVNKIVYAGVGKTDAEIRAGIEAGIGYFNIESEAEFENIARIAKEMGKTARAALRVNPDVDPQTHAKTTTGKKETKFGVDLERAEQCFARFGRDSCLKLCGLHLHIGSPVYSVEPYLQAISKTLDLVARLDTQGLKVQMIDIGGGFGADYQSQQSPVAEDYAQQIVPLLRPFCEAGGQVIIEPGRAIAANAGLLLCRVLYLKRGGTKKFVIVDTGMHHLVRPAMYDAFHFIWPTSVAPMHEPTERRAAMQMPGLEPCDVVGPICESSDYLAKGRLLPPVARGDLLAIYTAGAYGMVMASNYNAMPRPPEVLVEGAKASIIRRRETYDDLVAAELESETIL
jgi:diaminopimelate decarboxylase